MINLRNYFLGTLLFAAIVGGAWFWQHRYPKAEVRDGHCINCNVVLVSIDSLRTDHMSLYGYPRPTTPNIDIWASSGLVFEKFYATAYLTPISEASVHTGLYPEVNGLTSFRRHISPEVKTLAEILKGRGYHTAAFGNSPEFSVFDSLHDSFDRGFDIYDIKPRGANARNMDWPKVLVQLKKQQRPWFLWLVVGSAHAPFGLKQENRFVQDPYNGPFRGLRFFANMQFYYDGWLYDLFAPDKDFRMADLDGNGQELHSRLEDPEGTQKWPVHVTEKDLEFIRSRYDNGVAAADGEVGKLRSLLSNLGLDQNTLVVLESEHGESLGEHGYIAHYDIDEEVTHVPLVMLSPALEPGRPDFFVSGVDVMPTILSHLGVQLPKLDYTLDGKSVLNPEDGRPQSVRSEVYFTRIPLWESVIKLGKTDSIFDEFRKLDDQTPIRDYGVRDQDTKVIHRTARLAEERFSCWTYISGKKVRRSPYEFFDLKTDAKALHPKGLDQEGQHPLFAKLQQFEADVAKRARRTAQDSKLQDYQ